MLKILQARLQQYVNGENFQIFKLDLEKVDRGGNGTPLQYSAWKIPWTLLSFPNFAGVLSTAVSQHRLLGFEIAQLESHHLH